MKHVLIYYPATLFGCVAFALFAIALDGEMTILSWLFIMVAFASEARQ